MRRALVHRIPTDGPDDVQGLLAAIAAGRIEARCIVAILGKTEGNGCVNDFTRGFAMQSLRAALLPHLVDEDALDAVSMVMSGGTEGGLSPHLIVIEVRPADGSVMRSPPAKTLAVAVAHTEDLQPEEIGRIGQCRAVARAVHAAMEQAAIADVEDVHYVQVKCPLLTAARIKEAAGRGQTVATSDTLKSMALSRGASALGVALALGEVETDAVSDDGIGRDLALYSERASCSAGIELMNNEIVVIGNSASWASPAVIGHGVMADALDAAAFGEALASVGLAPTLPLPANDRSRLLAVLAKAEPDPTGYIRASRHTMLDDSDISATRHARALVGGVLAGVIGHTELFVSGGAEHQGPPGGGPVAVIASRD